MRPTGAVVRAALKRESPKTRLEGKRAKVTSVDITTPNLNMPATQAQLDWTTPNLDTYLTQTNKGGQGNVKPAGDKPVAAGVKTKCPGCGKKSVITKKGCQNCKDIMTGKATKKK